MYTSTPPPVPETKQVLRARFRAYRAQLSEAAYREQSRAIVDRLLQLPELTAARTVHLYWPMVDRHEVDVRPVFDWLHAQKKQIVLPVMRTFSRDEDAPPLLEHRRYRAGTALHANKWGVYEPSCDETVPLEELDLVVVPALGAGRNGHRIGHGYGYYDAFLRDVTVPRIALVYDGCLVDWIPGEPHDVPVTAIVTEHEVIRPPDP